MGASFFCFVFFTAIWIGVGYFLPKHTQQYLPSNWDQALIHLLLVMTAVCCYAMWLFTYMAQMNPLVGPQLSRETQHLMQKDWS